MDIESQAVENVHNPPFLSITFLFLCFLEPISSRKQVLQAQKVVDAANAHPELKVMAGFSRRFDTSYRDAKNKI